MFVYLWIILVSAVVAAEKCKFRFIFDTVNVKHWAPELVEELHYSMIQVNNRSYISGNFILKRNISKMDVSSCMDFWNSHNKKVRLFNLHTDTCSFLTMVHKNPIMSTFLKSLKKHTTADFQCPFKAKLNYTLSNWYLDEQDFPSYVPEGSFQTITEYFIEKKRIFRILTIGKVVY
ncbi:uncharacterized protein [Drosophila virilis]|uniref:Uncharacterized protein n=1 Tax=Drosophila virilis TaxID=7244 RepID=B4LQD9_DROVI|nr:uncharacterized protein LOC6628811 [Drosophila virilis]EDW63389.1 uncharacterized protein Dvir_GJ13374 [Drosophila virilis]